MTTMRLQIDEDELVAIISYQARRRDLAKAGCEHSEWMERRARIEQLKSIGRKKGLVMP
jgi:hypothetical protein